MSEDRLQILLVEDNPGDADLLQEAFLDVDGQLAVAQVGRLDEALGCLRQGGVDVVLLDLGLPDGTGLSTLDRTLNAAPQLPVVVLTGLEDEAVAIEAVRRGAQEYLVKGETKPRALVRAIHHAVERKRLEMALQESEARLRFHVENTPLGVIEWGPDFRLSRWSAGAERIFGWRAEEVLGKRWDEFRWVCEEDLEEVAQVAAGLVDGTRSRSVSPNRNYRKDGSVIHCEWYNSSLMDESGELRSVLSLVLDISERKRFEEELQHAKAAAETANIAKSQFLANMSHELRTPMNSVLGMTELALHAELDPTVRDYLQTAKESADVLLTLLNDLLDCAKIESGRLELESAPFSLRRVLGQTTRVLAVRASEKGIGFSCHLPSEVPDGLVGDQVRLRQVLFNLVGNAVKFTDQGEVTVHVQVESQSAEEACLEFVVRDTGVGIPRCDLNRIFEPFAQADPSITRRFGGTGLGLTISSRLVVRMGGRIWVESELGEGSTFHFTVRLPLAKELPREPEASNVPAAADSALRILLVEDNPANQKLAAYILQERGHRVETAESGHQGLRMAQENDYDVILMDVQMPGMDGLETTAAIRACEQGKRRVPIIAMTAHAMKGDRKRCLASGMDDYLSKPVNGHEMVAVVETLAAGSPTSADQRFASVPTRCPPPTGTVPPSPAPTEPATPPASVFDSALALKRCFNNQTMLREMIQCFFGEVDDLCAQMHAALERGDLVEVGRLGHRLKGTVVYLGAEPARETALRVEHFEMHGGEPAEAHVAVRALERQCQVLKCVLSSRLAATSPPRGS